MSKDYIDLVAVRFVHGDRKTILCEAPSWSNLHPGDSVTVRLGGHRPRAIVVDTITTNHDHDEYRFNIRVSGAKEPLPRIDSKVRYELFSYPDEDEKKEGGEADG